MPLRAANARSFNRGGAARNRPYTPMLTKLGVSAGAAFSVLQVSAAYFGPCKNVRRSSDNAQADIWFVRGRLDQGAFGAFIGAGGSGFCAKDYDQSGNGRDATQTTAANQPPLALNVIGGLPALQFAGSHWLATASFASSTSPQTYIAVAERTGSFAAVGIIMAAGTALDGFGFDSSANHAGIFATSKVSASATDSAPHCLVGAKNGASSVMAVDGAETNGSDTADEVGSSSFLIGASSASQFLLTGNVSEAITLTGDNLGAPSRAIVHLDRRSAFAAAFP